MHSPSVLHNNNILVLDNINKHNRLNAASCNINSSSRPSPPTPPRQRVARVVDNERKRDYLGFLAELHDANDPFKLFVRHSLRAGSWRRPTQEFRCAKL